jgi:hypothetical protein
MSISKIGAGAVTPPKAPEAAEPRGPDLKRDHDADDVITAPAAPPPPHGQGTIVDKKA